MNTVINIVIIIIVIFCERKNETAACYTYFFFKYVHERISIQIKLNKKLYCMESLPVF